MMLVVVMAVVLLMVAQAWKKVAPTAIDVNRAAEGSYATHGQDGAAEQLRSGGLPRVTDMVGSTDAHSAQVQDALMLVTLIGPGVLAGVVAIGLRSIGFCAKLLYEAIEEIDANQEEAVIATGASRGQQLIYGIVPQIMPAFAGISVFRWDINIRESTVLGLVGAGGIGLQLDASISTLTWTQVSLILLVILATVIVSEWVSAKIRHSII